MKSIVTKTGDSGETALLYGKRVSKNHIRVQAYGAVDELSSAIGLSRASSCDKTIKQLLYDIQNELVQLMGEVATDDAQQDKYLANTPGRIDTRQIKVVEVWISQLEENGGSFKGWIYSGETIAQAYFDLARTTCRRAERNVIQLCEMGATVRPELLKYLNRLSDLFWLLARAHI